MGMLRVTSHDSFEHHPQISFRPSGARLQICSDLRYGLSRSSVARSRLLTALCAISSDGTCPLPIPEPALIQWLKFVQPDYLQSEDTTAGFACKAPSSERNGSGSTAAVPGQPDSAPSEPAPASLSQSKVKRKATEDAGMHQGAAKSQRLPDAGPDLSIQQLCGLLQAADILMDQAAIASASASLASALQTDFEAARSPRRPSDILVKVAVALPEHLAAPVILATQEPLSCFLDYLAPPDFHPLILRSLCPQTDPSPHLDAPPSTPPPAQPFPTPAETAPPDHERLSLDSESLPHTCDGGTHACPTLSSRLSAAPQLHTLSLRNTCLAPAAAALAAALPQLSRLHTLHLSRNHLDPTFPTLAAALPSATALTCLDLNHTLSSAAALGALAAVLPQLPQLADLSLGAYTFEQIRTDVNGADLLEGWQVDGAAADALCAVLGALCAVTALRRLCLSYSVGEVEYAVVQKVAAALTCLTQLEHLALASPCIAAFRSSGPQRSVAQDKARGAQTAAPPAPALAAFTRLTSLDLSAGDDFNAGRLGAASDDESDVRTRAGKYALFEAVPLLTKLQELHLPRMLLLDSGCDSIVAAVGALPSLTRVAVHSRQGAAAADPVLRLLRILAELPQLQALCAPVIVTPAKRPPAMAVTPGTPTTRRTNVAETVAALLRAAQEKEVMLSLHLSAYSTYAWDGAFAVDTGFTATNVFRTLIPLCTSLFIFNPPPALCEELAAALLASQLTRLTRVRMSMDEFDQTPGGDMEEAWGSLVSSIGHLSHLEALSISMLWRRPPPGSGSTARSADSPRCVTGVLHGISALQKLRELEIQVQWGAGDCRRAAMRACAALTGLRVLRLIDVDVPYEEKVEGEEDGAEDGAFERCRTPERSSRPARTTWEMQPLAHLHQLSIVSDLRVHLRGLTQLGQLRSLSLRADSDMAPWRALVRAVQQSLPMLQEVLVESGRLGEDKVRMIEDAVPSRVRLHVCSDEDEPSDDEEGSDAAGSDDDW